MAADSTTMRERLRKATDEVLAQKKEAWEFSFSFVMDKVESILMVAAKDGQDKCIIRKATIEDAIKEYFSDEELTSPIIDKIIAKLTEEGLTVVGPYAPNCEIEGLGPYAPNCEIEVLWQ